MLDVRLTVRLVLAGPILTHSTSMGAVGIDASMARDSYGRYYLPYSLVRGRLRQSWEELKEATDGVFAPSLQNLLGAGSDQTRPDGAINHTVTPRRARLNFTDFLHEGNGNESGVIYRIRMDNTRGAAVRGAMQVIESPFAAGQHAIFMGEISYSTRDLEEANSIRSYITMGLRWCTNFGGERTAGFGRLINAEIFCEEHRPIQVSSSTVSAGAAEVFDIAIHPLAPFCIAKRRVDPNLFESDIILSGGVLRGALATTLKFFLGLPHDTIIDGSIASPWQELGENFNRIRFTHAFPALKDIQSRPVVAPLSLVKDAEGNLYDMSLCEGPGLLGMAPNSYAPSYAVDWKKSDDVWSHFGWAIPDRELRVRTAIDRNRRRARDEQPFAYDMVVPKGCVWYGKIDLSQVQVGPTRDAVARQLQALLNRGLRGIGKTKASADIHVPVKIAPAHLSDSDPIGALWVVTLQTPALLCDPATLPEASGERELFAAYDAAWRDLSGGALKLVRFFATQSLAGGYLAFRFQPNKPYNPFLVTDALTQGMYLSWRHPVKSRSGKVSLKLG